MFVKKDYKKKGFALPDILYQKGKYENYLFNRIIIRVTIYPNKTYGIIIWYSNGKNITLF
jgi:hypothetical protein